MLSKIRNRKGFTLIELMIVIAIIGILAALAIPNFLKFQARSKTSEAKTNLKGVYTAEASYYGEFGRFGNFGDVNWIPVGRTLIYAYSLNGAAITAVNSGTATGQILTVDNLIYLSTNGLGTATVSFVAPAPYSTTMTPALTNDSFIAGAAGVVSPRLPRADCWVINDNNLLIRTQDGV